MVGGGGAGGPGWTIILWSKTYIIYIRMLTVTMFCDKWLTDEKP